MIIDEEGNVIPTDSDTGPGPAAKALKWLAGHPLVLIVPALVLVTAYSTLWVMTSRIRSQSVSYLAGALKSEIVVKNIKVTPDLRIILEEVVSTSLDSGLKLPDLKVKKALLAADVPSLLAGRVKLREVFLQGAELTVYQEPDGTYNIARWLSRAAECDPATVLKSFPGRINLRGSRVVMEPPPGASWHETRELAALDGVLGLTKDGKIGADLTATILDSPVTIKGGMDACNPDSLKVKGLSDSFNFSALRTAVNELTAEESPARLPGGAGRLSFGMEGDIFSPYLVGKVSLKDFDAAFTYSDGILRISDFSAGLGPENFSGSGSVDFNAEGAPFNFTLLAGGVDLRRSLRRLGDFGYLPEGTLSGSIRMSGLFSSGKTIVDSGSIKIKDGSIELPDPGFSPQAPAESRPVSIPFSELSATLSSSNGKLRLSDIALAADNWSAGGTVSLGDAVLSGSGLEGLPFSADLKVESGDLPALVSYFPSLSGKIAGALIAQIRIAGTIGGAGGLEGGGRVNILKGFVVNPYSSAIENSFKTLDFDRADVVFSFSPDSLSITEADITGDGMDLEAAGTVGRGGVLDLRVKATLSPERARDFSGLADFVAGKDMFTLSTYTARGGIAGDLRTPVVSWREPSVTRWEQ